LLGDPVEDDARHAGSPLRDDGAGHGGGGPEAPSSAGRDAVPYAPAARVVALFAVGVKPPRRGDDGRADGLRDGPGIAPGPTRGPGNGLRRELEAYPPFTEDFLARYPEYAGRAAPEYLILGYAKP